MSDGSTPDASEQRRPHSCPNCGPAGPGPYDTETVRGGRRLPRPTDVPSDHDATWFRLSEIAAFKAGWLDGQGEPVTADTVALAGRFADALPARLHPLSIYPTESGGIEIEWRDPTGTHSITINPDQTLFLLSDDPADAAPPAPVASNVPVWARRCSCGGQGATHLSAERHELVGPADVDPSAGRACPLCGDYVTGVCPECGPPAIAAISRVMDLASEIGGYAEAALKVPDRELYRAVAAGIRAAVAGTGHPVLTAAEGPEGGAGG